MTRPKRSLSSAFITRVEACSLHKDSIPLALPKTNFPPPTNNSRSRPPQKHPIMPVGPKASAESSTFANSVSPRSPGGYLPKPNPSSPHTEPEPARCCSGQPSSEQPPSPPPDEAPAGSGSPPPRTGPDPLLPPRSTPHGSSSSEPPCRSSPPNPRSPTPASSPAPTNPPLSFRLPSPLYTPFQKIHRRNHSPQSQTPKDQPKPPAPNPNPTSPVLSRQ